MSLSLLSGCKTSNPTPVYLIERDTIWVFPFSHEGLISSLRRSTFSIETRKGLQKTMGTAFCIKPDFFLTCAHVVDFCQGCEIELYDDQGGCLVGRVIWHEPSLDVALIHSLESHRDTLRVSSMGMQVGEEIYSMGNLLGLSHTFSKGYISALMRRIGGQVYVQADLRAGPGFSGAPVVNRRGELIGMVVEIATHSGDYEGVTFILPAQEIISMLAQKGPFALKGAL
ncbi:MAG: S1C family serine protease [Bacteroidia bacterium]